MKLPHSIECERACLAGVLLSPILFPQMDLTAEDFYDQRHRDIWKAYEAIDEELGYEVIDLRTLQTALEEAGLFDVVGGHAYLTGLDADMPDLGRVVPIYAYTVRERAVRRRVIESAQMAIKLLTGQSTDEKKTTEKALNLLDETVLAATSRLLREKPKGFAELVEDCLEEAADRQETKQTVGLQTGLPDWDFRSHGLAPGEYWTVAGRPGLGKSTLAVNIANHVAKGGNTVLFCSVEQMQSEIAKMFLSLISKVDRSALRTYPSLTSDWDRLHDAQRTTVPLLDKHLILRHDLRTVAQVAAGAQQLQDRQGLDLLIVDYLHLLGADDKLKNRRPENRSREIGQMAWGLKRLAQRLEIPVIGVSQMSRESVKEKRKPAGHDLRDSGELEQHSDGIVFVWRPPQETEDGPKQPEPRIDDALLIVEKHRSGESGYEVPLVIDRPICTIRCKTEEAFL